MIHTGSTALEQSVKYFTEELKQVSQRQPHPKPNIAKYENNLQRGFTEGSSPMNCSLILEKSIHENRDKNLPTYMEFLDAKSAFDVVNHSSLLRKLIIGE